MSVDCHTIRFYQLVPKAVHCMKCEQNLKLLALSRSDDSIEVWNLNHSPYLERVMMGAGGSVDALAWFNRRLFSVGLLGSVIEYDLFSQSAKSMHPLTSGPSRCISIHNGCKHLAAGTQEGFINIFDITDDDIVYNKYMDRQEGKIICLEWSIDGDMLVSGSEDTVRVWNVSSGHAIHRMFTGRAATATPTIVWSIAVTSDLTIVTGDSRGKLCFWDGITGTSIASYQSHTSDVVALCLSQDENIVYCSGADPVIASYEKVKIRDSDERGKWVKSIQRVIHDHPVKALVICDQKLYSGGVDTYLAMSSYPPKTFVRYPPIPQGDCISVAGRERCVLLRYHDCFELWRLSPDFPDCSPRSAVKLIDWRSCGDLIKSAVISSDARWLAVSTLSRFRLMRINYTEEIPAMTKVKIAGVRPGDIASRCMCFSEDCSVLVCAGLSGLIHVFKLRNKDPFAELLHTFHPHRDNVMTDSIHKVAVSQDGSYVVAADLNSNIIVWSDGKVYCKLPRYDCCPTALAIHPQLNNLVIVYSNLKIVEYSLHNRKFTTFSRELEDRHPTQWLSRAFAVNNIMFDERNEDIIALHDDSIILVINKNKELPGSEEKIPRLKVASNPNSVESSSEGSNHPTVTKLPKYAFHVVKKYRHLVYVGSLRKGEIVAVELNPIFLKDRLPPPVKKNKFGEM